MDREKVLIAMEEAERFLSRARTATTMNTLYPDNPKPQLASGYNIAAMRRASMDLTRALADMRQS